MKNEREQRRIPDDGRVTIRGKLVDLRLIKRKIRYDLETLYVIYNTETRKSKSAKSLWQTPLEKILELEDITGFAKCIAELHKHGYWLISYLRSNANFIDAEYLGLVNSFCMMTEQISAARNLSLQKKERLATLIVAQNREDKISATKLKKFESERNKYLSLCREEKSQMPVAALTRKQIIHINKLFDEWLKKNINSSLSDYTYQHTTRTAAKWKELNTNSQVAAVSKINAEIKKLLRRDMDIDQLTINAFDSIDNNFSTSSIPVRNQKKLDWLSHNRQTNVTAIVPRLKEIQEKVLEEFRMKNLNDFNRWLCEEDLLKPFAAETLKKWRDKAGLQ